MSDAQNLPSNGLSYKQAGVDIDAGNALVEAIKPAVRSTRRPGADAEIGGFGGLFDLKACGFKDPVLVAANDGVGTKLRIAIETGRHHGVGIDLVAMSVNDILTCGAEPILFLDYFATSKIELSAGKKIIEGVVEGCRQAACALVGGETAEMPQVYKKGDFDLAGFCVGAVEHDQVISGADVRPGNAIIGIPSHGVHSNGFSLVRHILKSKKISLSLKPKGWKKTLGAELLAPTRIYVREILDLMTFVQPKAMAHITGGGMEGNLPRVLPKGVHAEIDKKSWNVPAVFEFLRAKGKISEKEMFTTFNMGIGYVLVVDRAHEQSVLEMIPDALTIGTIVEGNKSQEPTVRWKA